RRVPLAEVVAGLQDGTVREIFACGTAAVITPVGRLAGDEFDLQVSGGEPGELTMAIRDELTDIQYGRAADRHGWMRRLA
ncbi:MAG TPA: branched chain amino acid aminotransferase, partial [Isoptericola sp.]|nr:branched chain amino acid aminotransferase [Isoptericola sp.]